MNSWAHAELNHRRIDYWAYGDLDYESLGSIMLNRRTDARSHSEIWWVMRYGTIDHELSSYPTVSYTSRAMRESIQMICIGSWPIQTTLLEGAIRGLPLMMKSHQIKHLLLNLRKGHPSLLTCHLGSRILPRAGTWAAQRGLASWGTESWGCSPFKLRILATMHYTQQLTIASNLWNGNAAYINHSPFPSHWCLCFLSGKSW